MLIEKKEYYGIDLLKFIMSVLVVAIHTQPFYKVEFIDLQQRLFNTLTSLAVPYFFSASGFLLFSKINMPLSNEKSMVVCKKYLSRVFALYIIWNIIYFPMTIYGFKENDMSIMKYILDCIRGFFFIGQQFYSWQLWYLLSVIFVVATIYFLARHKITDKSIFFIMMTLFLMGGGIGILTTVDFSKYRGIELLIKCIKLLLGNGRILSGFGYIAVGWIVAKRKNLSRQINIVVGIILLIALFFLGDAWGFFFKLVLSGLLLKSACEIVLPQHPIWKHMRYASEMIYFLHMWVAFSYTLLFKKFRYYGVDIFLVSTLVPVFLYVILYRSQLFGIIKRIL